MNISALFSTRERVKILQYSLYKNGALSVNAVAKKLKVSKGLVSKFFNILVKEKVLKKIGSKFVVVDDVHVRAIKIFLNLAPFKASVFKKYAFVKSAGIYGSVVKGENMENSDIDIWIVLEKADEENIARLTNELKARYGNVKPLYLTKEKIKVLKKTDPIFYHSLIFGSITVYGEPIENF
jgi:predicted nucleotidyltransferase